MPGKSSVRAGRGFLRGPARATPVLRVWNYPPGTWTFTAPVSGTYEFAAWSPGFAAYASGPSYSGAFALKRVQLGVGQTVNVSVGKAAAFYGSGGGGGANTPTTLTFPDGSAVSVADTNGGLISASVATGGDVNIAGNTSSGPTVGAPAPSYGDYMGGPQSSTEGLGYAPGGGAPQFSGGAGTAPGGDGMVIVRQVS